MRLLLSLLAVLFLMAIPSSFALSTYSEVTAARPNIGGFHFEITARDAGDGMVEFRIVISGKKKPAVFVHPSTALGVAKITAGGATIGGDTVVPQEMKDGTMTCVFKVPEKSVLNDPDFCFIFGNGVESVINGKVIPRPAEDIYYVRLKDWYKKQP